MVGTLALLNNEKQFLDVVRNSLAARASQKTFISACLLFLRSRFYSFNIFPFFGACAGDTEVRHQAKQQG